MRISDLSSDVCSSDLFFRIAAGQDGGHQYPIARFDRHPVDLLLLDAGPKGARRPERPQQFHKAGLDECRVVAQPPLMLGVLGQMAEVDRKRVGWGKSVSVRVDLGGRRMIKKKK